MERPWKLVVMKLVEDSVEVEALLAKLCWLWWSGIACAVAIAVDMVWSPAFELMEDAVLIELALQELEPLELSPFFFSTNQVALCHGIIMLFSNQLIC